MSLPSIWSPPTNKGHSKKLHSFDYRNTNQASANDSNTQRNLFGFNSQNQSASWGEDSHNFHFSSLSAVSGSKYEEIKYRQASDNLVEPKYRYRELRDHLEQKSTQVLSMIKNSSVLGGNSNKRVKQITKRLKTQPMSYYA